MSNSKITCPVCNAERTGDETVCQSCGFEGAYYTLFSGENAYVTWRSLVDAHKDRYVGSYYVKGFENGSELLVTSDRVCFFDSDKSKAVMVEFMKNDPVVLDNVKKVSLSGLYRVWLYSDGSLGSSGDDESGQRRLGNINDVISIATVPQCTYYVKADGTVDSRGATPFKEAIRQWTDIKDLCCVSEHVIGIRNDNTVLYAVREGNPFENYASEMKGWNNVKKVVATDYYSVALCYDGTVRYAGVKDKRSGCVLWNNIVDIAADGLYVVGLTQGGAVLLAGDSSSLIDFGRSQAADWHDMLFIATGRSVIAGLSKTGELKIVGNVIKNDKIADKLKTAVESNIFNG